MKRGLLYSVVILLLVVGLSLTQKNNSAKGSAPDKVSFGVKIGIIPTGGLTQYALVFYKGERLQSIQELGLDRLIKFGMVNGLFPGPLHFTISLKSTTCTMIL